MEEPEENMSAEDHRKVDSPSVVKKPKKRSLVERELETNMTSRVTAPAVAEGLSTSRYGRSRRLKTESDLNELLTVIPGTEKSPRFENTPLKMTSPVYRMHASNSPQKAETPKKADMYEDNQIDNIHQENISLSRFSDDGSSPSPAKKFPKVYVRKDLIQKREAEETIMLIKHLFSPNTTAPKSSSRPLRKSADYSSEKYSKINGHVDNASVVKTLDFDSNKKKKKENKDSIQISKNELFELEAKSSYQVGDLAWARMGTFPFWPCIITREPYSEMFVKSKLFGRVEHNIIHVTFLGDNGRRSWIMDNMLRKYLGQLEFESTRQKFTLEDKKKDPRLYAAFFVSEKKQTLWNTSVEEAETLFREPKRLRVDIFNDMLWKFRASKKNQKSGKIARTNSDVSLSESLYDSLFSEDDAKADDSDQLKSRSKNKPFDVSEVVTACLDNMAAKTGITKIQKQSHMDRWLQKAKSKTPEKSQTKSFDKSESKQQVEKVQMKLQVFTRPKHIIQSDKNEIPTDKQLEKQLEQNNVKEIDQSQVKPAVVSPKQENCTKSETTPPKSTRIKLNRKVTPKRSLSPSKTMLKPYKFRKRRDSLSDLFHKKSNEENIHNSPNTYPQAPNRCSLGVISKPLAVVDNDEDTSSIALVDDVVSDKVIEINHELNFNRTTKPAEGNNKHDEKELKQGTKLDVLFDVSTKNTNAMLETVDKDACSNLVRSNHKTSNLSESKQYSSVEGDKCLEKSDEVIDCCETSRVILIELDEDFKNPVRQVAINKNTQCSQKSSFKSFKEADDEKSELCDKQISINEVCKEAENLEAYDVLEKHAEDANKSYVENGETPQPIKQALDSVMEVNENKNVDVIVTKDEHVKCHDTNEGGVVTEVVVEEVSDTLLDASDNKSNTRDIRKATVYSTETAVEVNSYLDDQLNEDKSCLNSETVSKSVEDNKFELTDNEYNIKNDNTLNVTQNDVTIEASVTESKNDDTMNEAERGRQEMNHIPKTLGSTDTIGKNSIFLGSNDSRSYITLAQDTIDVEMNVSGNSESILESRNYVDYTHLDESEKNMSLNESFQSESILETSQQSIHTNEEIDEFKSTTKNMQDPTNLTTVLEENCNNSTRQYVESPTFTQLLESEEFFRDVNEPCENSINREKKDSEKTMDNLENFNKFKGVTNAIIKDVLPDAVENAQNVEENYEDSSDDEPSPEYESLDEDIAEDFRKHMKSIESNITDKKNEEQIVKICNEIAAKAKLSPSKYTSSVEIGKVKDINTTDDQAMNIFISERSIVEDEPNRSARKAKLSHSDLKVAKLNVDPDTRIENLNIPVIPKVQSLSKSIYRQEKLRSTKYISDVDVSNANDILVTSSKNTDDAIVFKGSTVKFQSESMAEEAKQTINTSKAEVALRKEEVDQMIKNSDKVIVLGPSALKTISKEASNKITICLSNNSLGFKEDKPKDSEACIMKPKESAKAAKIENMSKIISVKSKLSLNKNTSTIEANPRGSLEMSIIKNINDSTIQPTASQSNKTAEKTKLSHEIHIPGVEVVETTEKNDPCIKKQNQSKAICKSNIDDIGMHDNIPILHDTSIEQQNECGVAVKRHEAFVQMNQIDSISIKQAVNKITLIPEKTKDGSELTVHKVNGEATAKEISDTNKRIYKTRWSTNREIQERTNFGIQNELPAIKHFRKSCEYEPKVLIIPLDKDKLNFFNKSKAHLIGEGKPESKRELRLSRRKHSLKNKTTETTNAVVGLQPLTVNEKVMTVAVKEEVIVQNQNKIPTNTENGLIESKILEPVKLNGHYHYADRKYSGSPELIDDTEFDVDTVSLNSEDSEMSLVDSAPKRKLRPRPERTLENALKNPEFLKYLELRQDFLTDEQPELNEDEVLSYIYKTWQYEEDLKSNFKKSENVLNLNSINGLKQETPSRNKCKKSQPKNNIENYFRQKYEKCRKTFHFDSLTDSTSFQCTEQFIKHEMCSKSPDDSGIENSKYKIEEITPEKKLRSKSPDSCDLSSESSTDILLVKDKCKDSEEVSQKAEETFTPKKNLRLKAVTPKSMKKQIYDVDGETPAKQVKKERESDTVSIDSGESDVPLRELRSKAFKEEIINEFQIEPTQVTASIDSGESEVPLRQLRSKAFKEEIINDFQTDSTQITASIDSGEREMPLRQLRSKAFKEEIINEFQTELTQVKNIESETALKEQNVESVTKHEAFETASNVSDNELLLKQKKKKLDKLSIEDPEFKKYMELRQDALMDENPHLKQDEILSYLYKTWIYEEKSKSEIKKNDEIEQASLVKGLNENEAGPSKKVRRRPKMEKQTKDDSSPREKPKRRTIKPYYNENCSDFEDEVEVFEIFKSKKSPFTVVPKVETEKDKSKSPKDSGKLENVVVSSKVIKTEEVIDVEEFEFLKKEIEDESECIDATEMYFSELTKPKPSVFKGLMREKVCEICEVAGNIVKCKGCIGTFHADCVRRETETIYKESSSPRGRKKKKGRKPKSLEGSESQSDDISQNISADNMSVDEIIKPEICIIDTEAFESQLSAKMRELLDTADTNYDCYSSDDGIDWENTVAGKCEIVEVKLKHRKAPIDDSNFKCNNCLVNETPVCFVCRSAISKTNVKTRQKCHIAHCHKYYHLECLDHWPQTQFNSGEPSRSNKKIHEFFEALTCPRHVCHTCVSDDPRGCKTRFSGDKLAKCVRCPATYHSFNKCLPAGTQILTASHVICPRHLDQIPGKVPCHVNTGWCFICALGGSLICCEYCPTSFHAECLNIKPPEGNYMCEDCETGRLPLYGEMVWVKLGHYRWWPAMILHPSEIPDNIMAVKHSPGEFVVRFFGQYDHYWVNRGRVFPYQEGDSGHVSNQKTKINAAFMLAVEHAQRAYQILKNAEPNDEESLDIASSLLPPHYVKLKCNKPSGSLCGRKMEDPSLSLTQCDCNPNEPDPCGPYSQCLNRMLLTECGPTCLAGERCNNRAFEKRLYPKLIPYRTPHRGWGLKTLVDIKAGQFVIEYVGELIDEEEFRRRMRRMHEIRDENFYFLTLDKERMIDAGPKGNLARFMNHCCEPNCETQKWTVLGDVRVGLFAIDDIPANSEVTFNYNLQCAGIEKKKCMCGAKRCSGYIGAKPKQDESQSKKGRYGKVAGKRTYKKKKSDQSPGSIKMKPKRPLGRPPKPKELTEIEKDLLIIQNATNLSSSNESSRTQSLDGKKSIIESVDVKMSVQILNDNKSCRRNSTDDKKSRTQSGDHDKKSRRHSIDQKMSPRSRSIEVKKSTLLDDKKYTSHSTDDIRSPKTLKRKRVSVSTEEVSLCNGYEPSVKKQKCEEKSSVVGD